MQLPAEQPFNAAVTEMKEDRKLARGAGPEATCLLASNFEWTSSARGGLGRRGTLGLRNPRSGDITRGESWLI